MEAAKKVSDEIAFIEFSSLIVEWKDSLNQTKTEIDLKPSFPFNLERINHKGSSQPINPVVTLKASSGQPGGISKSFTSVSTTHLTAPATQQEKVNQEAEKRWMQIELAYKRIVAKSFSPYYSQVVEDWDRRDHKADARTLAVYIETMFHDKDFKKLSKNKHARDHKAFSHVANNPRHQGLSARHGWGYHQLQNYNPEYAYMDEEAVMLGFFSKMMQDWEDHLVRKALITRLHNRLVSMI